MNKLFTDEAWDEFEQWQRRDRKIYKRIFALINDMDRNPFDGIGNLSRKRAIGTAHQRGAPARL